MDAVTRTILRCNVRDAQVQRAYEAALARNMAQAEDDDALLVWVNKVMTTPAPMVLR